MLSSFNCFPINKLSLMNTFSMLMAGFTFKAGKQKGSWPMQTQLMLGFMLVWMKDFMGATLFTSGTEWLSSWDHMQTSCSSRWHVHCPYRNTLHPNPMQTHYREQSWLISSHRIGTGSWCIVCYIFSSMFQRKNIRKERRYGPLSLQHNQVVVMNWEQELVTSFLKTWQ